jgi:hypothetical protein
VAGLVVGEDSLLLLGDDLPLLEAGDDALHRVVEVGQRARDQLDVVLDERTEAWCREKYERWLEDDASLFDAFDQEIELHPDPAADWVGVNDIYRAHDGVRSYMAQVYEAFEDYRPEVEDLLDAGADLVYYGGIAFNRTQPANGSIWVARYSWVAGAGDQAIDARQALSAAPCDSISRRSRIIELSCFGPASML